MLIQKKYNYKQIDRIDTPNGRRYLVDENNILPSVTTIISKMQDTSHLTQWVNRVGSEEAERIRDEASSLGSEIHKNLENFIIGLPPTGSVLSNILSKVIIKNGLKNVQEVWGSEVALYSTGLYAGTCDLIGLHNNIPSIIDYKNSLKNKKKEWIEHYFMQLCAYSMAHNEMFGTDIHRGVVMIATRDARYQEFVIEGDEYLYYETKWANTLCEYYAKFDK